MKTKYIILITIAITLLIIIGGLFAYNGFNNMKENIRQDAVISTIDDIRTEIINTGYIKWDNDYVLALQPIGVLNE